MNKLSCEVCGSSDIIKQDGVFVCQSCGCKYTLDEVKKMTIEGTVNVQGTVSIDNAPQTENYILLMHRERNNKNWEKVEEYSSLIIKNDPTNIEAIFYESFAKNMVYLSSRTYLSNLIQKLYSLINYCNIENSEYNQKLIVNINSDLINMYKEALDAAKQISIIKLPSIEDVEDVADAFIYFVVMVALNDNKKAYWEIILEHRKFLASIPIKIPTKSWMEEPANSYKKENHEMCAEYTQKIIDKNF